jgi:hydroxymethylpyrimidine/phosphomethylpyrimidine kinase
VTPPVALTIAGSDSGGGAGIQADLKTFAAHGVFGASVVTAVTAQNTAAVRAVHVVPLDVVAAQLDAVLDDMAVAATKTGMLATPAIVDLVVDAAAAARLPALVVDPVMVSSTGVRLLDPEAERLYVKRLLPAARVFTPNLVEAGVLLGRELHTRADQRTAARDLAGHTDGVVVVKGGHATADGAAEAVDVIACGADLDEIVRPRIVTDNNHGSGCSFASAIAAGLARRLGADAAIRAANDYVHAAIRGGAPWNLGSGHGPLDHFHWEES